MFGVYRVFLSLYSLGTRKLNVRLLYCTTTYCTVYEFNINIKLIRDVLGIEVHVHNITAIIVLYLNDFPSQTEVDKMTETFIGTVSGVEWCLPLKILV
jgi:hypothetical protein